MLNMDTPTKIHLIFFLLEGEALNSKGTHPFLVSILQFPGLRRWCFVLGVKAYRWDRFLSLSGNSTKKHARRKKNTAGKKGMKWRWEILFGEVSCMIKIFHKSLHLHLWQISITICWVEKLCSLQCDPSFSCWVSLSFLRGLSDSHFWFTSLWSFPRTLHWRHQGKGSIGFHVRKWYLYKIVEQQGATPWYYGQFFRRPCL